MAAVKRVIADGFQLTECRHEPDAVIPMHDHAAPLIGIVLAGYCVESQGRRTHEHAPLGVQILPAGHEHAYAFSTHPVHCLSIEVMPHRLERIRCFSSVLDRPRHIDGRSLRGPGRRLYQEFRRAERGCALTIEGLLLEILGIAAAHPLDRSTRPPQWLRNARDFLHAHAAEKNSVTELALLFDVHPSHLMRAFRKHYGAPVGDYVRRLRVTLALDQLAGTMPLAQVATAAGFYDQSHLTRCFKLEMGLTPAQYRSSIRRQG